MNDFDAQPEPVPSGVRGGQVVVGGGEPVVAEQPLRIRHRLDLRRRLDEPGRDDLLLLAQRRSPARPTPARHSGVAAGGVVEERARPARRSAGRATGIASGLSGDSRAISSAFRTARCRLASLNSAVVTVPAFLPKFAVIARL